MGVEFNVMSIIQKERRLKNRSRQIFWARNFICGMESNLWAKWSSSKSPTSHVGFYCSRVSEHTR